MVLGVGVGRIGRGPETYVAACGPAGGGGTVASVALLQSALMN